MSRMDSFWFSPRRPEPLALCRIVFCGALFALYAGEDFRFAAALAPLHWEPISFVALLAPGPPSAAAVGVLQVIWKASLLATALGVATRPASAIAFLGAAWLFATVYGVARTSHEMAAATLALGVLALSRCGDAWSVDAALARRRGRTAPEASAEYRWPIQLVRVVVCLTFFGAGVSKLRDGGLAWIFSDSLQLLIAERALPFGLWIASHPLLCRALAAGVVLVETLHPLALVSPRAAALLVPASFGMLLGFRAAMGVPFWPLAALHVFWIPWDRLLARRRE